MTGVQTCALPISHANSLATLATSSVRNFPRVIIVEDLCTPTSPEKEVCQVNQINPSTSWMDPILNFLESDVLPDDKVEAEKIRRKAPRYCLSEDKNLYNGPSLGHTCSVCFLKQQSRYWRNCMKAFVEAIQEEGL